MKVKSMFDQSEAFSMERFSVEKTPHTYEYWVNLTAKLINRPYFQTHKLVEDWPLDTIIQRYEYVTKHSGNIKPDILWWSLRKKDKPTKQSTTQTL